VSDRALDRPVQVLDDVTAALGDSSRFNDAENRCLLEGVQRTDMLIGNGKLGQPTPGLFVMLSYGA